MMHWTCTFSVSRPFFYLDSNYTLGKRVWRNWTSPRTLDVLFPPVSGHPALRGVLDHNGDTVSLAKPAGMELCGERLVPSTCPCMLLDPELVGLWHTNGDGFMRSMHWIPPLWVPLNFLLFLCLWFFSPECLRWLHHQEDCTGECG